MSRATPKFTLHPLAWRRLLGCLVIAICWLAFSPRPPPGLDAGWDKLNHLIAFAALGPCAWFGFAGSARRALGVPAGLLAFGAFIEVVQTFIPGRSGEWPDLLADAAGIAIGLAAAAALEWRHRKSKASSGRLTR